MQLNEIKAPKGSRKKKRIVGRGRGSGRGKTSGRGENGQRSRAGRWVVGSSEGGQMPLIRRLPKVGFRSHRPKVYQIVKLESLNDFEKGAVVNPESLKKQGLVSSLNKPVKILGNGEISKALTVQVKNISKTAEEKILKAGGKIEKIDQAEKKQDSTKKKK